MQKYNLYGSEGCHLCEQALELCLKIIAKSQLSQVDIIDTEHVSHEEKTLVELYGVHIPVLEKLTQDNRNNTTLFWPFTQAQLNLFVSS